MISTKSIIVLVFLAIYTSNIECNNADGEIKPFPLATRERDLQGGLRDVWDQVKNSAISSWNFLKKVSEDTRNKITKWTNTAREYAIKIERSFEEQLQDLQRRLTDMITDILGTGKLVQECLETEEKHVEVELKQILKKMSECVSNQLKQLTQINGKQAQFNGNDTLFMAELDNKLETCKADKAHYEECLYTVRGLVYDELEELDNNIQKTNLESRGLADDIRNTLTTCFRQNLVDASSYITSQIMDVVRCVLDGKGIKQSILE